MQSNITQMLSRYEDKAKLRLHMPGHGGALSSFDVTELSATDDLLRPERGILQAEELAADLFSAKATLLTCGGATQAIQAALAFHASRLSDGARVFCERKVHQSVVHAMALLNLQPEWVDLQTINKCNLHRGDLLIFSGCDYFGSVPDYPKISEICRSHGVHTVVDNAHGAHLAFWQGGIFHPLAHGFELVIDSAHKTLPVLTGAALLHVGNTLEGSADVTYPELKRFFAVFGTSSPNFLILQSLDEALCRIRAEFDGESAKTLFAEKAVLDKLRDRVGEPLKLSPNQDPFRLILRGEFDFEKLNDRLWQDGISCEFFTKDALIMIPRFGFSELEGEILADALEKELTHCSRRKAEIQKTMRFVPQRCMSLRQALLSEAETLPVSEACGRVCAEVFGEYPPGLGLVMPGEILERSCFDFCGKQIVRVVRKKEEL